jgi:hypothetical protein
MAGNSLPISSKVMRASKYACHTTNEGSAQALQLMASGEWFNFEGDDAALELLLDGFTAFSDDNPDRNSR